MALLCIVGLMYGGSMALFYSIVFDIFGPRNYRSVFSVTVVGFGAAVLVGGLSAASSFQPRPSGAPVDTDAEIQKASAWFFGMAGCCFAGKYYQTFNFESYMAYDCILLYSLIN